MNVFVIIAAFLLNCQFMMLTTLLPILIYNISNSTAYVGQVLIVFMIALLAVRVIFLKKKTSSVNLLLFGSISFLVGFIILYFLHETLSMYYVGSVFFGISLAILAPVLLTIMTSYSDKSSKNVGLYNSIVGVSSIISPYIGEKLYQCGISILNIVWLIGAVLLLAFTLIIIYFIVKNNRKIKNETTSINYKDLFTPQYRNIFIVLLLSSISYGAIISYLPVYLSIENTYISIGLYYFIFWSFYIIAQFFRSLILKKLTEKKVILACLVGLFIGEFLISLGSTIYIAILSAILYGFSYGLLYNVLYFKISKFDDEHIKSNGYAIVGLMSYVGVGLAPIFLYPFLNNIKTIFMFSTIYVLVAFIYFVFRKKEA